MHGKIIWKLKKKVGRISHCIDLISKVEKPNHTKKIKKFKASIILVTTTWSLLMSQSLCTVLKFSLRNLCEETGELMEASVCSESVLQQKSNKVLGNAVTAETVLGCQMKRSINGKNTGYIGRVL